jgi:chromosome segregation ATPase
MADLREEVATLQKQVTEFEEALRVLENPPERYGPRAGENGPLDFLRLELAALESERERESLLEVARQSLQNARGALVRKQEELNQLLDDCEQIANEMIGAGEAVKAAEIAYQQSLKNFQTLAEKHQHRWSKLNGSNELFRQIGRIEFPSFVISGVYGFLTTDAIARDLR